MTNTELIEMLLAYPPNTPLRHVVVDGFDDITIELEGFFAETVNGQLHLSPMFDVSKTPEGVGLPQFFECPLCGYFHKQGDLEWRWDDGKFTRTELDTKYGLQGYEIV